MNHLQRRAFGLWWKMELFLAFCLGWSLVQGAPVYIVGSLFAMVLLAWLFRKDWKEARGHDDWY